MRLVTSCPACNTLFHVRQEQLSLEQPEVRCGQCREVFSVASRLYSLLPPRSLLADAAPEQVITEPAPPLEPTPAPPAEESTAPAPSDYIIPEHISFRETAQESVPDFRPEEAPAEEAPAEEAPAEEAPAEEAPVEEVPVEEAPVEEAPVEEAPVEEAPAEEVPAEEVPAEETQAEETQAEETQAEETPSAEPSTAELSVTAAAATAASPDSPRQRTETLEVLLQPPRPQVQAQPVETSFLDDRERLHTPLLPRWLAIVLALLLSLGALAQSTYFFRTEIASHWPASKPWLVSACTWLGCSVPLARHAELLALDDSDLQENLEHPEVIQLSTTLINNASYTQAYPMLELTLTDDDDQPKLRRIFTPQEYLKPEADIEAGLPANEEIQIKLSLSTSDVAVSGYRVFVTY